MLYCVLSVNLTALIYWLCLFCLFYFYVTIARLNARKGWIWNKNSFLIGLLHYVVYGIRRYYFKIS